MTRDSLLQHTAAEMTAASIRGDSVLAVLRSQTPWISRQIVADSTHRKLFSLWGRSCNFDENARKVIVDPAIVTVIGELAGHRMSGSAVHAGLLHTYGYLFSPIQTPYGAKRDRWVLQNLEDGFDIGGTLLSDEPRHGTLLANATWFFGNFALRGRRALNHLAKRIPHAAPELRKFDYSRSKTCRIIEEAEIPEVSGTKTRRVRLITDLVSYPKPPRSAQAENTLLIYSVQNGKGAPLRLITGFPVRETAANELRSSMPRRGTSTIRLRYNAFLPEMFARTFRGRRFLASV